MEGRREKLPFRGHWLQTNVMFDSGLNPISYVLCFPAVLDKVHARDLHFVLSP